jgi:hypothetical protein
VAVAVLVGVTSKAWLTTGFVTTVAMKKVHQRAQEKNCKWPILQDVNFVPTPYVERNEAQIARLSAYERRQAGVQCKFKSRKLIVVLQKSRGSRGI